MNAATRIARMMTLVLPAALAACVQTPPIPDMARAVTLPPGPASVTVPFHFEDNRVFVEVRFIKPDGSEHKALAFVNMGFVPVVVSNALYRELQPSATQPLRVKIGGREIDIDGETVQPMGMANSIDIQINPFSSRPTAQQVAQRPDEEDFFAPLPVEASIPAGLLEHFTVTYDYAAKTMTLAVPGGAAPDGVAVPIRVNPKTGFVITNMTVDGATHPVVIDNGGSYTAVRSVNPFIAAHPERLRSVGGIGEANYVMTPFADAGAPVARIPRMTFGPLEIDGAGVIQSGSGDGWFNRFVAGLFWNFYSAKAGEDVQGFVAGNVLKSFKVTFDYRNRMSYWAREAPIDTTDLDQIGITLARAGGKYTVGGIALKDGKPSVEGVQAGDVVIAIDGAKTAGMTRGDILAALHGKPGEHRHLVLKRSGKQLEIDTSVTAF
jgi:PDZ domain